MLDYKKTPLKTKTVVEPAKEKQASARPALYVCDDDLRFALDTALVTGRPLLLCGDPGIGKSTFARWVAANAGWRFYKHVVTSHSRPSDLLYRWDAVRRLADAQAGERLSAHSYVEPGPLWWAISPDTAKRSKCDPFGAVAAHDQGVEPQGRTHSIEDDLLRLQSLAWRQMQVLEMALPKSKRVAAGDERAIKLTGSLWRRATEKKGAHQQGAWTLAKDVSTAVEAREALEHFENYGTWTRIRLVISLVQLSPEEKERLGLRPPDEPICKFLTAPSQTYFSCLMMLTAPFCSTKAWSNRALAAGAARRRAGGRLNTYNPANRTT